MRLERAYAPVKTASRRSRGRGLVLLVAYGLAMVYRRDRSQIEPGSIVLSLAGDTTNEEAFVSLY